MLQIQYSIINTANYDRFHTAKADVDSSTKRNSVPSLIDKNKSYTFCHRYNPNE